MTEPVRVLEVLAQSAGGIGRHVAELVEGLDGRDGLELDIAAAPGVRVALPKQAHAVPIPTGVSGHRAAIRRLGRLLENGAYAVVHAHGLRAAVDAGVAARRARKPLVFTVHNVLHPTIAGRARARILGKSERLALKLATRVLAPSEEIKAHLSRRHPASRGKIEILHLGVQADPRAQRSTEEVRRELDAVGRPLGVTVGRLAPQKALHVLLDAWRRVRSDALLAILGEGPLEASLKSMAQDMGIEERVRWLGFRDDTTSFVAAADVFCLSSVWEAVALAAQEAVALGIPVVTTDAGGMRELIEDGATGRLVAIGDSSGLARAIEDVFTSPEQARRRAAAAGAVLKEKFSRPVMLERIAALYRELAGA